MLPELPSCCKDFYRHLAQGKELKQCTAYVAKLSTTQFNTCSTEMAFMHMIVSHFRLKQGLHATSDRMI